MPPEEIDRLRLRYGLWIIITGFALVAFITVVSIFRWAEVTSVATVVGAVSSLVGTVVGPSSGSRWAPWERRGRRPPASARKRR
jgi:Trk-type K+ transport system membrane component